MGARAKRRRQEEAAGDGRSKTCWCEKPVRSRAYCGWILCALCQRLIHPEDL